MNPRDFLFWLRGLLESDPNLTTLNEAQVDRIKAALNSVFFHVIDPQMGTPEHRKKLDEIHNRPGSFRDIRIMC